MHLKSLSPPVRDVFATLAIRTPLISDWRLVGGAALSLDMGHRAINDLNFVASRDGLPLTELLRSLNAIGCRIRSHPQTDAQKELRVLAFDVNDCYVTFATRMHRRFAAPVPMDFFDQADVIAYHHLRIPDRLALFDTKCIAAMTRISATDVYDLWWMTHWMEDPYPIDILQQRVQHLMPYWTFEDVRRHVERPSSSYGDWDRVRPTKAKVEPRLIESDMELSLGGLEQRVTAVM